MSSLEALFCHVDDFCVSLNLSGIYNSYLMEAKAVQGLEVCL